MQVTDHETLALIITAFNKTVSNIIKLKTFNYSSSINFNILQKEHVSLNDESTVLAISYTIIYADSSSGEICGFSTIPATSCGDKICSNVFEISSTSCFSFTNISVSFYASSSLGNGPASGRTLITLQHHNDSEPGLI